MKEIAEYLCDEFVDFEGKVHKFVLCALSKVDPECDVTKDEFVIPSTRTVPEPANGSNNDFTSLNCLTIRMMFLLIGLTIIAG